MEIDVEEYYKRYGPMVLRRCRSLLNDEHRALDAMQDVFVKVILNKAKLKHQYPSSLLYTIATNICLNMIKADKKISKADDHELLLSIASYDEPEEKIVLKDFIDYIFKNEKISTKQMAVMHYIDKLTLAEVANETGLSISGVRKRLRTFKSKVKVFKEELR
jgi:RNA polymerase sigma-70 factor (ECF subfamily)